jgi:hypothetical protein
MTSSVPELPIERVCDDCDQCPDKEPGNEAPLTSLARPPSQVRRQASGLRRVRRGIAHAVYVSDSMVAHGFMLCQNVLRSQLISDGNSETRNTLRHTG